MSDVVIHVDRLGKQYRIGARSSYQTLRERITSLLASPLRYWSRRQEKSQEHDRQFWALKDASLEVRQGEVVGIIGRNGAGKSTLLKILSRITEPTEGEVNLRGRVGSLLEVGTGFHPELTGRENIFLNGAILGMKRADILAKFDEIVAFAEVEKFIYTPVKFYSSGMYMRLAFAVAAHLEPEILIIDEVLAVGDGEFQKKCLGKMSGVAKSGRTVLFVSHNMGQIQRLCSRCVILNRGHVAGFGETATMVRRYLGEYQVKPEFHRPANPNGCPTITRGAVISDPTTDDVVLELTIESGIATQPGIDIRLTDNLGNPVGFGSLGAFAFADRVFVPQGTCCVRIAISVRKPGDG